MVNLKIMAGKGFLCVGGGLVKNWISLAKHAYYSDQSMTLNLKDNEGQFSYSCWVSLAWSATPFFWSFNIDRWPSRKLWTKSKKKPPPISSAQQCMYIHLFCMHQSIFWRMKDTLWTFSGKERSWNFLNAQTYKSFLWFCIFLHLEWKNA